METFTIIRVVINVLSFLGVIIVGFAGWYAFRKITANHLCHIDEDLKELKSDVKENRTSIVSIDKSLAVIATKLNIDTK